MNYPLSDEQKEKLRVIHSIASTFYMRNDNPFTLALTGLLMELSGTGLGEYLDVYRYIPEKVEILRKEIERA